MERRIWIAAVLLLFGLVAVNGLEWYETGHQHLLDWSNFDKAVQFQGKFKFIKFFTRNCRYCRLLKQVEQQLQEERKWSFQFYSVDCSVHYDLCMTKAGMSAFPYIAIYNSEGKLHGTIGGYYPLDTMRQAFNTIEKWQNEEVNAQPGAPSSDLKATHSQQMETATEQEVKTQNVELHSNKQQVPTQHSKETKAEKRLADEDDEGWNRSIKDGLKLAIILLGVIIFNKTVAPYLLPNQQDDDFSKPRTIEIPLNKKAAESAKGEPECSRMLSDSI